MPSIYSFALIHSKSKTRLLTGKQRNIIEKCLHGTELLYFLVELAMAEQDFCLSSPNGRPWSEAFPAETMETGDKNRDKFHCM